MQRTNIFLPVPTIKSLKALSLKTGLAMSEHVRRALDDYLKNMEIKK